MEVASTASTVGTEPFNFVNKVGEFNKKIGEMMGDIKSLTTRDIGEPSTILGKKSIYDIVIEKFTECSVIISEIIKNINKSKPEHLRYFQDLYNNNFKFVGFNFMIRSMKTQYDEYQRYINQRGIEIGSEKYDKRFAARVKIFFDFRKQIAIDFEDLKGKKDEILQKAIELNLPSGGSRKSRKTSKKPSKKPSKKASRKASKKASKKPSKKTSKKSKKKSKKSKK